MSLQEKIAEMNMLRSLVNTFNNPEEVRYQLNYLRSLENEVNMAIAKNR